MKKWRAYLAEFVGIFILTFVDAGLAVIPAVSQRIDYLGRVMAPGLVVMTVIFTLGEVSGAHINPAVTAAFTARGVFPWRRALTYFGVQIIGAVTAAMVLLFIFGDISAGLTTPKAGLSVSCFFEMLMTMCLVFTVLTTAYESNVQGSEAAFPVGFTLMFCGLLGKDLTGASMNPARSLGTALVGGHLQDVWIYLVMPLIGSMIAVALVWLTHGHPTQEEAKAARG